MSALNETLIRDVVTEVLGRLGQAPSAKGAASRAPSQAKEDCGCPGNGRVHVSGGSIGQGRHGVFQDANEACAAAQEGFRQLKAKGVAGRSKIVEIVKSMAETNANEWGRIELEE